MTIADEFAPQGLFTVLEGAALALLPQQTVRRGDVLIAAGTSADAMYLVRTGRFRVARDGVDLAEIGPGSVIGEIAFFTGKPRTADVIAARDSVVLRVAQEDYEALCRDNPGLARAISGELADRLARTSARVVPDPGRPPARTFCILPSGQAPLPARFIPDLTAAIGVHHSVAVVTEQAFREAMGPKADPASPEAVTWLNDQERRAEIVIFVATPEAEAWSEAALRQADQLVLVAQAVNFTPPSEIERSALSILPESQRRLVLLHPHKMQRAAGTGRWLDSHRRSCTTMSR